MNDAVKLWIYNRDKEKGPVNWQREAKAMKDINIFEYFNSNKRVVLHTDPSNHDFISIRHIGCVGCDNHDYFPGDEVPECIEHPRVQKIYGKTPNMAKLVEKLLRHTIINADEDLIEAAQKWFAQFPDGPQVILVEYDGSEGAPYWSIKTL